MGEYQERKNSKRMVHRDEQQLFGFYKNIFHKMREEREKEREGEGEGEREGEGEGERERES